MKFHDIPDLPIRAFMHNGIKGKICLYKGGGDVVDWAKDQLDETPVVSNPSDTFSQIDKEIIQPVTFQVNDVAQKIGDVGNQIDQSVNDNVPGGWVLPAIVAAAVVAPEILPEIAPELASEGAVGESAGIGDIGLSGTEAGDLSSFTPTDTSYLNDFAPTDTGTTQLGSGTSLSPDAATNPLNQFYNVANPEVQANLGTVSNLVGGGAESNLATLNSLSNPLIPTTGAGIGGSELGAIGSIIGSGEGLGVQTLPETLAPTGLNGLTVNDLNSQPLLNNGTSSSITGKDVANALRAANSANNLIKGLTSSQQKLASNQQNLQQSQALGNLLKANQFTPIATPEVYKAQNPFTFGQQEPIQGNPLASLLRNNYG